MLLTLMWLGVGVGMFTLIVAAMRVQDGSTCKGYEINIRGAQDSSLFTSKEQIVKLLRQAAGGEITGQRKSGFDLPRIEDLLEQSSWVFNAELYFDNKDILRVNVTERKPLARVFASNGQSFYIDETGKQIPLSDKISLDVPVFTGYPNNKIMTAVDSSLLKNMITAASFISSDSFWVSQVSQIDIHQCGTNCWNMEMIPVVGNHRVDLGDGSDIASKFHRLYLFYDQVLKRTGFDKYGRIEVQYNGQVVGIKGAYTKLDSLQLRKNIEELLQQSRKANDLIEVARVIPGVRLANVDTSAEAKQLYAAPAGEDGMDTLGLMSVGEKPEPVIAAPPADEFVEPAGAQGMAVKKAEETKPVNRVAIKPETHKKETPVKSGAVKTGHAKPGETARHTGSHASENKSEVRKDASGKTVKKTAAKTAEKKTAAKEKGTVKKTAAKQATIKQKETEKKTIKKPAHPAGIKETTVKKKKKEA